MLTLPEEHRKLFEEPFGNLHRNINEILPSSQARLFTPWAMW